MDNNSNNIPIQEVMRLAKTPAGQQLIALLQQSDPTALRNAAEQASGGHYQQAKNTLEPLLSSPEIQKLLKQLGEK